MASPAQIIANHENSTHSTGPRTTAGKKRVSLNAFRHGLTSQTVLLPTEDATLYLNFTASYQTELKPKGVVETQLVQTLADIQWRLNRARSHEAAIFALGKAEEPEPGAEPESEQALHARREGRVCIDQAAALKSLSLHEHRWQKLYLATLKQFTEMQTARREREEKEMPAGILAYKHLKEHNIPYNADDFGFVLTKEEIEFGIWRSATLDQAGRAAQFRSTAKRLNI